MRVPEYQTASFSSTQEVEAGDTEVQDYPWLHVDASLGSVGLPRECGVIIITHSNSNYGKNVYS